MAFGPQKRKATFAKRSAAKRTKKNNNLPTVMDALLHGHGTVLPANLRSLLKGALPIVLNTNKADRHAYETEVVNQAQQALVTVQNALEQEHAGAMAKQNQLVAPNEEASRVAAKKAAEANLEAAKAQVETNKATRKACEKATEEASDALKAANKEERAADKELQRHVAKKAHLENTLAHEFAMLKDGDSHSAEGKKAVAKVVALGKECGLGGTILLTLPLASKKLAVARSEFEGMVFTQLQSSIEGQIHLAAQHVAEAEPIKAAKDAAVAGAKQRHDDAKAAEAAADAALEASQTAVKEANKEVHRADHHMRHIWEDMRHACDAQDKLASDLKNLRENIWSAFMALKEKEPEPEPVEPEPVVEEAAAEVAAPAEAAA